MKPERPNVSREELMRALTYGLETEKNREAEIFTDNLPLHSDKEARLYGSFCSKVIERLEGCESKVSEWRAITEDYNTGQLVPALFELKGRRTERALRRWVESYQTANFDCYALIHQGTSHPQGSQGHGRGAGGVAEHPAHAEAGQNRHRDNAPEADGDAEDADLAHG